MDFSIWSNGPKFVTKINDFMWKNQLWVDMFNLFSVVISMPRGSTPKVFFVFQRVWLHIWRNLIIY